MKARYPYWVVIDVKGWRKIELEVGPLVPIAVARRMVRRSKQRFYRLVQDGKLRCVHVMGQMFTPMADVEKQFPEK